MQKKATYTTFITTLFLFILHISIHAMDYCDLTELDTISDDAPCLLTNQLVPENMQTEPSCTGESSTPAPVVVPTAPTPMQPYNTREKRKRAPKHTKINSDDYDDQGEEPDNHQKESDDPNFEIVPRKPRVKRQRYARRPLGKEYVCSQEALEKYVTQGCQKFEQLGLKFTKKQKLAVMIVPTACETTYQGANTLTNHFKGVHLGLSRTSPKKEKGKTGSQKFIKERQSIVDIWRKRAAKVTNDRE